MTTEQDEWTRIMTKAEYLVKCADVYFGEDAGQSIATTEGQIFGNFGGKALRGTWDWEDGYFCRTSTLGDLDLGSDCIVIEVTPTKMRLTMEKGNGPSVVYDRKDERLSPTAETDDIVFLSSFDIKEDAIDDYINSMLENQRFVRAEDGNLEMRLFQDVNKPGVFFVFGRTAGQAGLASHLESVEERGIANETAAALNAPPIARRLGAGVTGAEYGNRDRVLAPEELIVFAIFDFKSGYRDKVIEQYKKQIPLVRADDANILFNVYPIYGQPDKLAVYERWTSPAAGQKFATTKPTSIETGALLAEGVKGELGDYLYTVTEIEPYKTNEA